MMYYVYNNLYYSEVNSYKYYFILNNLVLLLSFTIAEFYYLNYHNK